MEDGIETRLTSILYEGWTCKAINSLFQALHVRSYEPQQEQQHFLEDCERYLRANLIFPEVWKDTVGVCMATTREWPGWQYLQGFGCECRHWI